MIPFFSKMDSVSTLERSPYDRRQQVEDTEVRHIEDRIQVMEGQGLELNETDPRAQR